ncbi:MAG: cell division protein FtsK [Candidatus Fluviicola riflensis]|nr:MAG: cell division protein FtsK [Candidatus Fluviicola riflensis]OGS79003.1 MAG: cell division protein FtsK [Candidatus Fluviicola riflensis]OGS86026.1 MAG: cell division protein FtsK [Fluviicola sp. RIFCSPHIGHO2_12_FULL_43_24]OGS86435.1 MAG: cell division protein FtsK [Fluviicola sp. RIFCSPHIGHO2_01_FULL_43_53]
MAVQNEFREKNEEKPVEKQAKKKVVAEPKQEAAPKTSLKNLGQRLDKKRTKTIIGVVLTLFSFFTFLSCFSFFFTWTADQDRILDKGLFEFLMEDNPEPVANWLGKFGAWMSHLFMYRWFGISSFAISFMIFLVGFKWMLNIRLFPLKRSFAVASLFMVWSSIFLGYFVQQIDYLGGTFGYTVNQWLTLSIGSFGSFIVVLALLYVVLVILFNADIRAWMDKFKARSQDMVEDEDEVPAGNAMTDIHVVNTIKENQIVQEEDPQEFSFEEEEDEEDEDDVDSFIVVQKGVEPIHSTLDDDFEIEVPVEAVASPVVGNDDFDVAIADADAELSNDQLNSLQKEYGDYDPKLDLAGYVLPPIELLKEYGSGQVSINKQELEDNKNKIVETLSHYKIDIAKIKATVGPTVTLYEIVPAPGVRISKIKNLEDDIALSLSALGIRIIAPIPGKGTIGIEVPNSKPDMVSMRSLIASEKFQNSDFELPIVIGKTITNETFTFDLTKMPHLLVAGSTGQGKSVGLNAILVSMLYKKHPAQVKFVLVDPKKVELTLYNRIERHFLAKLPGEEDAIITDTSKVVNTLNSLCIEMDARYELLKEAQVRTIKEYNAKFIARRLNPEKGHHYLPYIVVLIDEFADLIMTAGKEVEHPIARLAQLARAIGIHLIVATQRPSVNVITGMIKANFPARIAFRVLSKIDSRTILDASGADQLIGRGDMLIATGSDIVRVQCGFADTPEVEDICKFIGEQRAYPEALILPEYVGADGNNDNDIDPEDIDSMFADAARIVVLHQQGSASLLQRKLKLGYNRAGRIVDQLEGYGIIGPFQGSKAREVLYSDEASLEEFLNSKGIS